MDNSIESGQINIFQFINKFKYLITCCIFILNLFPIYAVEIRIPFGNNDNQVGVLKTADDFWFPRFFGLDEKKNIFIPDFYKHRISVFSSNGEFINAIPAPYGLRPDMNYFNTQNGNFFITFAASVLYVLNSEGELVYNYDFGIGQFPDAIICTETYIFVVMPSYKSSQGLSIVFNYSNPEPIGLYGKTEDEKPIPLFTIDSENTIPVFPSMDGKESIKASWLGITTDGRFLWHSESNKGSSLLTKNTPDADIEVISVNLGTSDSFRTIRLSPDNTILVMDFIEKGYVIREYPLE